MNAGSQVVEDFWGLALSKNKKELDWEVEDEDSDSFFSEKSLELRQACLGASAKEGERNVVELITDDDNGDKVTHTLLSMRVGGTEQSALFLTLQPPVKFKLVQGSGPIHIVGQITETIDLNRLDLDSDDDEEGEEEVEEVQKIKETSSSKKRPASSLPKIPSKMAKMMPDSEMDTSNNGEDHDGEESDSEAEDESEDGEEEEEEDESEEEEKVKPTPKKPQTNGNKRIVTPHPKAKLGSFKTPQVPKAPGTKKTPSSQSLPSTPKDKKKNQGKVVSDISEIKQRLAKMNVPKKMEKFNNFVSNSFKIKDESVKKELWEFVQKNRPEVK